MNTRIAVQDKQEARAIRAGLADPQARAFVKVIGILKGLSSDRARNRVLTFVRDNLEEANGAGR